MNSEFWSLKLSQPFRKTLAQIVWVLRPRNPWSRDRRIRYPKPWLHHKTSRSAPPLELASRKTRKWTSISPPNNLPLSPRLRQSPRGNATSKLTLQASDLKRPASGTREPQDTQVDIDLSA